MLTFKTDSKIADGFNPLHLIMKYLQVILELCILLQIFSFEACISNTIEKEQCFAEIFKKIITESTSKYVNNA